MNALHFKLPSGRVLLFEKPLTSEELEACTSPLGIALLEQRADQLMAEATVSIGADDPAYEATLKEHGIAPGEGTIFEKNPTQPDQ